MPCRGLHPVGFQEPNRFRGGQMPALRIGRPEFERGDEFAIALELLARHDPRLAAVGPVDGAWTQAVAEYPLQGVFRHPIELRCGLDKLAPLRTAGRQHAEAPSYLQEGVSRELFLRRRVSSGGTLLCRRWHPR